MAGSIMDREGYFYVYLLLVLIQYNGPTSAAQPLSPTVCMTSLWQNVIKSSMITASSNQGDVLHAKLDCCTEKTIDGGWCGKVGESEDWIEIDFPRPTGFMQLVLQKNEDGTAYAQTITVQYMQHGQKNWNYLSSNPSVPMDLGALNSTLSKTTLSTTGIAVTKLRINIKAYHNKPCLRFDVRGCSDSDVLCPQSCQNGGSCFAENYCVCPSGYSGALCEKKDIQGECKNMLGMANGGITGDMLHVSSSANGKGKEKARYGCCDGEDVGAWCPDSSDQYPWYQVDFKSPKVLSGIAFQHPERQDKTKLPDTFMNTFNLLYTSPLDPQRQWRTFADNIPAILNGTVYYNVGLNPYVITDSFRIYPKTFQKAPCFRFEALGCNPSGLCPAGWCQNGGTCIGNNLCKCPEGFFGDKCDEAAQSLKKYTIGFTKIVNQVLKTSVNINFQITGNVVLDAHVIEIKGPGSYLTIENQGFNACLKDIDSCTNGFTLSLNVNLANITDGLYIISSGGDLPDTRGIALFYIQHHLHFVVTTSTKRWHLTVPNSLNLNVWHKLELSWSKTLGVELLDNGHVIGTVSQPQTITASQVKRLSIGYGYQKTVSISLKVKGFQTFDASREVLTNNGVINIKSQSTTLVGRQPLVTEQTTESNTVISSTTAMSSTTPSCEQQNTNFTFDKIVGDILITPSYNFTVHKSPSLRPEANGSAVLVLSKNGQYVELPNHGLECIQDMTKCEHGFTLSAEIKLLDLNTTDKMYLFSSGGDIVNNSGIALYIWHGQLYCSAKKDRFIWTAKKNITVKPNEWHTFQVSWNKNDGFFVFIDGSIFMKTAVKLPNPTQNGIHPLLIATSPGYNATTLMEIRNLYTWSASRESLIGQGCITEYTTTKIPPTTTVKSTPTVKPTTQRFSSTSPTTKPTTQRSLSTTPSAVGTTAGSTQRPLVQTHNFRFTAISNNLLITPTLNLTVHGNPVLENDNSSSVLVLNKPGQYVEWGEHTNTGCFDNLVNCKEGFTFVLKVKFLELSPEHAVYLLSSTNGNATGISLSFVQNNVNALVIAGKRWELKVPYEADVNVWHTYTLSWNVLSGLTFLVDGIKQGGISNAQEVHVSTHVQPLLIGKLHGASYTAKMKITDLHVWSVPHTVLLQSGIIPTVKSTPTTPPTTQRVLSTTPSAVEKTAGSTQRPLGQTNDFRFTAISNNLLITPTLNLTVHGNPALENDNSSSVLVLNKPGQYVEWGEHTNTGCFDNLVNCKEGFTFVLKVKFLELSPEHAVYLLSSTNGNATGISLSFLQNNVNALVIAGKRWELKVPYETDVNVWHTYTLSWNVLSGLTFLVDGIKQGGTSSAQEVHVSTHVQPLLIGKPHGASYTAKMKITDLHVWSVPHTVLLQSGIITTVKSTPTTPPTTQRVLSTTPSAVETTAGSTQSPLAQTHSFRFTAISNNLLITPTLNLTVHGNPVLENDNSSSVLVLNKPGQYVEWGEHKNTGCFDNLVNCKEGFTFVLKVKFLELSPEHAVYLLSSTNGNATGISLSFVQNNVNAVVIAGKRWELKVPYETDVNVWHTYTLSWNVLSGLTFLVDGIKQGGISNAQEVHVSTHVQPLLIGKPYGASYTAKMKITDLHVWSMPHTVLLQSGIITTAKPTTTTTLQTTTKPQIPTYEWNFVNLHANTLVVNNITATAMGTVDTSSTGTGLHLDKPNQYIDFGSHVNLCLGNINKCSHGITISITLMFQKLEENTIIISNGGENPEGTGIALLYKFGQIQCVASTSTHSWFGSISREKLQLNKFQTIIVSWSQNNGLKVIIDGHVVSSTVNAVLHHTTNVTHNLYIGKSPTMTSSTEVHFYVKTVIIYHVWIGVCIDNGIIPPPSEVHTTTTETCHSGYVCKDWLTTTKMTTATPRPTETPKPPATPKPTETPRPTKTPKPTETPRPTETPKPTETPRPTESPRPTETPKPTTTTPATTTTPRPAIPPYTTTVTLTPETDRKCVAFLSCKFRKTSEQDVELVVCLNVGTKVCHLTATVDGNTNEHRFLASQINMNLYHQRVTCSVQARYKGQSKLTTVKISPQFRPDITLTTANKMRLTEGHEEQTILAKLNAPPEMFCCKGCNGRCQVQIGAKLKDSKYAIKQCNRHKIIPQVLIGWHGERQSTKPEACGAMVTCANWRNSVSIPVKATIDGVYDRDREVKYTLQANVLNFHHPPGSSITTTTNVLNIGEVPVVAVDNDHKAICSSVNDPHMTTFDGRRYNNFNVGEFILYRHKTLPFEVRASYKKCSSRSRATCNCAAAVKSGDDVITFTACGGSVGTRHGASIFQLLAHRHGRSSHGHSSVISVAMFKNGELTPGTQIRRYGCGQKYEVVLPTGTVVTIQSSSRTFINIWVKPSSVDRRQTEGLCGNFDGNRNNDILGVSSREVYPNAFCIHWRPSNSIFTGVVASATTGMSTYCSCVHDKEVFCSRGYGTLQCEKSRYDITSSIVSQAMVPRPDHGRHRRQAEANAVVPVLDADQAGNYTIEDAREYCRQYIENSTAAKHCDAILSSSNYSASIENCAVDMELTGDPAWAQDSVADIVSECLAEVEKTVPLQNSTADNVTALVTDKLCDQDCGPHGSCSQGICQCDDGYSGDLCDIAKTTKPYVLDVLFNDTSCDTCGCDTQERDDCTTAIIYGSNFVESSTLTCHYRYIKVTDHVEVVTQMKTVPASYISLNQVSCKLPETRHGAFIQISNDGQTMSDDAYIHVVYDSICYDCTVESDVMNSSCTRRENTCVINGQCFKYNDKKESNACKVCDPSESTASWTDSDSANCTKDTGIQFRKAKDEDSGISENTVIIIAVLAGVLGFLLVVALFYICNLKGKIYDKESAKYEFNPDPALHEDSLNKKPSYTYDNALYNENL